MNNTAIYSSMIRAGKTTYFVDVREAKNGRRYLSVSETHLEGDERKRSTIRVFDDAIEPLRQAIGEAASVATT